jgi:hypothetical protein
MRPKGNIDLGDYDFLRFVKSQRYFGCFLGATVLGTAAPQAGRYHVAFLFCPVNISMDRIAFNVTIAGAAGTKGRAGIYEDNGVIYPGKLVLDGGEFAVDTTGIKETTISPALILQKGKIYWLVFQSSGTPTLRAIVVDSVCATVFGVDSTLPLTPGRGYYLAGTYGALPSTFPAGGLVDGGGQPSVFLRKV